MGNKIQRIYIGENQVYPVYRYSYDFRDKTLAGMQSDGWTFGSTSGVTINSDGLTCSSFNASIYCSPSGLTSALSTAKKVTMELYYYKGTSTSSAWTQALFYLAGPSDYTANGTGCGAGGERIGSNWSYSIILRILGGDLYRNQYTVANGDYTEKAIIDFENKTMRLIYGNIVDTTKNITDAQISTIRTLKFIRIGNHTTAILKSIGLTIEC